jgi:thiamine phosphate synthase YjbQ (UPF0047 family)
VIESCTASFTYKRLTVVRWQQILVTDTNQSTTQTHSSVPHTTTALVMEDDEIDILYRMSTTNDHGSTSHGKE